METSTETMDRRNAVSADAIRLSGTLRAAMDEADRLILIASAYAGEGVSTITAELGAALAMTTRESVLVIDTNLRHPSLHDVFQVSPGPGVTEFVGASAQFEAAIRSTSSPTLSVLPSGQPAEGEIGAILQNVRFTQLLQLARQHFRYVLLDSAPLLQFADGVVVAQQVDGALIVLSALQRKTSEAAEMTRLFQGLNTKVLGAVISRA